MTTNITLNPKVERFCEGSTSNPQLGTLTICGVIAGQSIYEKYTAGIRV